MSSALDYMHGKHCTIIYSPADTVNNCTERADLQTTPGQTDCCISHSNRAWAGSYQCLNSQVRKKLYSVPNPIDTKTYTEVIGL